MTHLDLPLDSTSLLLCQLIIALTGSGPSYFRKSGSVVVHGDLRVLQDFMASSETVLSEGSTGLVFKSDCGGCWELAFC